ncbi:MAG: hypothetical protein AB7G21_09970 [Dehalococcoidia bacterium]
MSLRPTRLRIAGLLARSLSGTGIVPGQIVDVSVMCPTPDLDTAASALYRVEAIVARRTARGEDIEVVLREADETSVFAAPAIALAAGREGA